MEVRAHTPQVGDTITEAESLDALPVGSVVIDRHRQALVRWASSWGTDGVFEPLPPDVVVENAPFTLVYLPGQPPRPERIVKAEALREAANEWQAGGWADDLPRAASQSALVLGMARHSTNFLRTRADRIERGE